jgi:predicted nucleotidyltransferase
MIDLTQNPEVLEACKTFQVKRLHVYGSFASGEITAHSDIDLLVEFDREGYSGAFEQLMNFKAEMKPCSSAPWILSSTSRSEIHTSKKNWIAQSS